MQKFTARSRSTDSVLVDDFENFKKMVVEIGKTETAKHYGVTRASVANACKRYGIEVKPYFGPHSINLDLGAILKEHGDKTPAEIAKILGIPKHQIRQKLGDKLANQFSIWEEKRIHVDQNIEHYRDMHYIQRKNLLQISKEEGISYDTLKKSFAKHNIPVRIYAYNKSGGELEILEFLRELTGESFSVRVAAGVFSRKGTEIDCFSPEYGLGIEYCGEFWHSAERRPFDYHQRKEHACRSFQISLITVFENEYKRSPESFKRYVKAVLLGEFSEAICDDFKDSDKIQYMKYHFIEPKDGLHYSENPDCVIAHDASTIYGVAPKAHPLFSVGKFLKETNIRRAELDNRSVDRIWFLGFDETITLPRKLFYDKKNVCFSDEGILLYDCGASIMTKK